jgi:hypothetical protein
MVEAVKKDTEGVLQRYREGETVVFPTFAHVVVAHA